MDFNSKVTKSVGMKAKNRRKRVKEKEYFSSLASPLKSTMAPKSM